MQWKDYAGAQWIRTLSNISGYFVIEHSGLPCKYCGRVEKVLTNNHRPILFPAEMVPAHLTHGVRWPTREEFDEGVVFGDRADNQKCSELIDFSREGEIEVMFG